MRGVGYSGWLAGEAIKPASVQALSRPDELILKSLQIGIYSAAKSAIARKKRPKPADLHLLSRQPRPYTEKAADMQVFIFQGMSICLHAVRCVVELLQLRDYPAEIRDAALEYELRSQIDMLKRAPRQSSQ
ncbi:hypothetical protein [Cohnella sp. 56]|uniref:hypothetical protein n=1 Tax=Cohnella sp. 56 TaxID=3113722 RepID=UPI0030E8D875